MERGRILSRGVFAILFLLGILSTESFSQVNCTDNTPFFQADLSASPTATWLSPSVVRDGSCCGGGANQVNCVEIEILLHPDAEGILFEVESGANPGGALYYQVNCEGVPLSSPNNTICLDGAGPHYISYCKVGNNQNTYSITSIPTATTSNDIVSSPSCPDTLSVTGVDPATITWNSISPGNPGDYNSFLSNLDGTDQGVNGVPFGGYTDVLMTPAPDAPEQIIYEVCATPLGGCEEYPFCENITVEIYNDLTLEINPQNPTICFGDNGVDLTANVTGGIEPLEYNWSTGETTQTINVQNVGEYSVEVTDGLGCMVLNDNVEVNEITTEIIADAGTDITVCAETLPTVALSGYVTGTNSGIWLNGQGDFDPDNETIGEDAVFYTPSQNEVDAGFVKLTLNSTNNLGCPGDSDDLRINLPVFNTDIDSTVINVSCAKGNDGAVHLEELAGNEIQSYMWNTSETSQDITNLTAGNYDVQIVDENNCERNYDFQVTEPEMLIITECNLVTYASGHNISCHGLADGEVTTAFEGGVEPYTFEWSNGDNTADLNDAVAGDYTFTITDANGCTADTTISLLQPPGFQQDFVLSSYADGNNISCFGEDDGSIDYTVSGGTPDYDYVWSNGETTEDISGLNAGTYSVTTTDVNGCETSSTIELTEPDPISQDIDSPTYFSGDNISCFEEDDGSINYDVNGGSPDYNYVWSNGATSEDLTDLTAGTYNVTVTDVNGCTAYTSITLTQPDPLNQDINSPTLAGDFNISCFGNADGSIDLTIEGGAADYSFVWNNGETTEDLNSLTAGTYSVNTTDMNGCTIDTSITLTEPPMLEINAEVTSDYNGQDISCFNASDAEITGTVNGGSPNYTLEWTDNNGNVLGGNLVLNGLAPDDYTLTVEDINGCTALSSVTVTQPDLLIVDAEVLSNYDGMEVSCEGESDGNINSQANGGTPNYTYSWNTNPVTNSSVLSGVGVGEYVVTATDVNGCTDKDTVVLNAHPLPSLDTSLPDEACEGETVSFSATSDIGEKCKWVFENGALYNGFTHNNTYFNDVGCFNAEVTTTSAQGCSTTENLANLICINPIPYADFSQSKTEVTTFSPIIQFWNQSNGETSVEWSFGDGEINQTENPYHEYPTDSSGTYQVQLVAISQYGCTDTVKSLVVIKEELLIFVPNTFTPDNDDYNQIFYPVLTPGFDPYSYELLIFNRWGEVLFESHDATVGWDGTYGGKIVKYGTYVWKIVVKDKYGKMRNFKGHVNVLK